MKDIIDAIVRNLVFHPNAVKITGTTDGKNNYYQISVIRSDRGMLIGKEGKTINAINHIVHAMHKKDGFNAVVEVVEEA